MLLCAHASRRQQHECGYRDETRELLLDTHRSSFRETRHPQSVQAPGARPGAPEKEEQETVQDRRLLIWLDEASPEAVRRVVHEVGKRHFAREQKRERPREQPEHQHRAADELQHGGERPQRRDVQRNTRTQHFVQPVEDEQEPRNDAQRTKRVRGEARPLRRRGAGVSSQQAVDAPDPRTCRPHVEKEKRRQQNVIGWRAAGAEQPAAVHQRVRQRLHEPVRQMRGGQHERHGARQQTQHQQEPAREAQQLQRAEQRGRPDVPIGAGKPEHLFHPVPEDQEADDDPRDTLQLRRQARRDGARHCQFTTVVVDNAGFTKRAAGICAFGWTSVSSNCDRPLSQRTVQRNGIFTPATSR